MTTTEATSTHDIITGTNGRIYWVDTATRRAELATCGWLVQRPTFCPEPDFPEDLYVIEACGARLTRLDDDGWECALGHYHHAYGSDAWEADALAFEQAERLAEAWDR